MSEIYETSRREITKLVNSYARKLNPTREFLGFFIDLSLYCHEHCSRGEKDSLEKMRECFTRAEKGFDSNEANRKFVQGAKELCEMCGKRGSGIPAVFNLINKICANT